MGTYAENVTQEYIDLGHDVSVFTLNGGNLKTREILRGVEVHRPLIADASNVFPFLWFEDAMAQSSDRIITVSYAMQQDLIRHGWSPSKVSAVWNGVDPERYSMQKCKPEDIAATREKYCVPKDCNMLLFVGRLSWVKGARNLLLAMPSVLKEYPKLNS